VPTRCALYVRGRIPALSKGMSSCLHTCTYVCIRVCMDAYVYVCMHRVLFTSVDEYLHSLKA